MKVSIIYVYFNTPKEIKSSISSIAQACKKNSYEIIIVDNNSRKKIPPSIVRRKDIEVIINSSNRGFGAGCNIGAKKAKGEYLLFLNPDTVLSNSSIDKMLQTFKTIKKVGIVGPSMVNVYGETLPTINSYIKFPYSIVVYSFLNKLFPRNPISKKFWMLETDRTKEQRVDVVSGACMLIKSEIFNKVRGFDERFFMYFEEQDLCFRITKLGYKTIFNPKATIVHAIGASLSDKATIKGYFQKSRFLYFKKHFGVLRATLMELPLRLITSRNLLISLPIFLSLFLNLYKQDTHMLFIGDSARDFLAARDMILSGQIPLVGIPSSAQWLHQGPTSVWLIGIAFLLSNFNPVSPAILFGLIGAITTGLVWYLGKFFFNEKVGLISAFLYATSPLIVVNARMPYHTSLIPFFAALFFIVLAKTLHNKKLMPLLFFCFGLLLLVELSNIVVFGVVFILFLIFKVKIKMNDFIKGTCGFLIGILPFVIYEILYGPSYLKFPLWIVNRIRLFFFNTNQVQGVGFSSTTVSSIYQEIAASIMPNIGMLSIVAFIVGLIFLLLQINKSKKKAYMVTLFLWIIVPLISFLLHSSPGQAYFTLLFPAISLLIGYLIYSASKIARKTTLLITFCIVIVNILSLLSNDFYVFTNKGAHLMPPMGYSLGYAWNLSNEVSKEIVKDAKGKPFSIEADGIFKLYKTSLDPYVFLTWKHGGKYVPQSDLTYIVTDSRNNKPNQKVIYESNFERVLKK